MLGKRAESTLEFFFGTAQGWLHGHTAEDAQMASIMSTFWANLAKYGDPNELSHFLTTGGPGVGRTICVTRGKPNLHIVCSVVSFFFLCWNSRHSAINVTWPPFTGKDGLVYLMNLHPEAVRGLRQGLCDLWDDICKYGDC